MAVVKCDNCGAEIPEGAGKCDFCDSELMVQQDYGETSTDIPSTGTLGHYCDVNISDDEVKMATAGTTRKNRKSLIRLVLWIAIMVIFFFIYI